MASLGTSPGHTVGQIIMLERRSKAQDIILMVILLAHSTSGITSGKKVCRELKMAAIFKILKHISNLTSDMERPSQIMQKEVFFMVMTPSMTSQGGLKVPLHIHV